MNSDSKQEFQKCCDAKIPSNIGGCFIGKKKEYTSEFENQVVLSIPPTRRQGIPVICSERKAENLNPNMNILKWKQEFTPAKCPSLAALVLTDSGMVVREGRTIRRKRMTRCRTIRPAATLDTAFFRTPFPYTKLGGHPKNHRYDRRITAFHLSSVQLLGLVVPAYVPFFSTGQTKKFCCWARDESLNGTASATACSVPYYLELSHVRLLLTKLQEERFPLFADRHLTTYAEDGHLSLYPILSTNHNSTQFQEVCWPLSARRDYTVSFPNRCLVVHWHHLCSIPHGHMY